MPEQDIDVNPSADPSPADAAPAGAESENQTQTADSSAQPAAEQAQDLSTIVREAAQKSSSQEDDEEAAPEGEAAEPEAKAEGEKKETDDKGPVPYTRFAEVNSAKVRAEQALETSKPLIEAQRSIISFCQEAGLSEQDFAFWMQAGALSKTNPEKALEMLAPQLESLRAFKGEALPKDLQEAVDAGEIKLEHAKRIVAAEARLNLSKQQSQTAQQRNVEQRQAELARTFESALETYVSQRKQADPDFRPKASEAEPDGKYEIFLAKLLNEVRGEASPTVDSLVACAERVYKSVNSTWSRFTPKVNGTRQLRTNQSTAPVKGPPKTLQEVVAARAKMHGIALPAGRT